jgi:hypothetical protein
MEVYVFQILMLIIGCLIGALQAAIFTQLKSSEKTLSLRIDGIHTRIDDICKQNDLDSKFMWKRIFGHKHDDIGNVVIPHESL